MLDRRRRCIRHSVVLVRCRSRFDRPFPFLSGLVFLFVGSAYASGTVSRAPLSDRGWYMDAQPFRARGLQRILDDCTTFFGSLARLVAYRAGLVSLRGP